MKDFPIPVVTVGPGAQETADDEFRYLELPREMSTFQMPGLPDPESARGATEARGVLRWLAATTAVFGSLVMLTQATIKGSLVKIN